MSTHQPEQGPKNLVRDIIIAVGRAVPVNLLELDGTPKTRATLNLSQLVGLHALAYKQSVLTKIHEHLPHSAPTFPETMLLYTESSPIYHQLWDFLAQNYMTLCYLGLTNGGTDQLSQLVTKVVFDHTPINPHAVTEVLCTPYGALAMLAMLPVVITVLADLQASNSHISKH